ncbi:MAG TPA: inositol 2-dehydrogenase, partial [Acetobacteraceae bacterium]|nr:inositol 2-dehydrogenase [Acetobacteraceae bacterium]
GAIHAANAAAHPALKLTYVVDPAAPAAERLAATFGAVVASTGEVLADGDVAGVIIASSTDTHLDHCLSAAAAGKSIFCEKPIDLDLARARAAAPALATARILMGFNRRFDPHFAMLKQRMDAGEIGRLELLTIFSKDPGPPPISYVQTSGGLFRDCMIHDLDMARFLLGEEPVELHASASCLVDPAIGAAGDVDTAVATLRTASGKLCQISNSRRATYGYDQRIEAHGEKGLLRAGNVTATTVEFASESGFASEPALPFFLERYAEAYRRELDAFITAVAAGQAPRPSGEDGLKALRLADAATRSAQTGETVRLGAE